MAIGQLIAPCTCAEVPVKSTSISSPRTLTHTTILSGSGDSPKPSIQSVKRYSPSGMPRMNSRISRSAWSMIASIYGRTALPP